jgi:hypothetical protein
MKLTTFREPAQLVLWPTLVELLVLAFLLWLALVDALVPLDGLVVPELVLELSAGAVDPEEPDAVVPELEPAPLLGVGAVAGAVPVLELGADGVAPLVDGLPVLVAPAGLPGADVDDVGAVPPPGAFGSLAAGGVEDGGGEYMSGSSSMVIGVARTPCRGPVAAAGLVPGRPAKALGWLAPEAPATVAAPGTINAAPSTSAPVAAAGARSRVA